MPSNVFNKYFRMQIPNRIHSWFSTTIYYEELPNEPLVSKLTSKAQELKKIYTSSATAWRCSTFNTLDLYNWETDRDPSVLELIEKCARNVGDFAQSFSSAPLDNYELACTGFWFNVAEPGAYQEYHQHASSHFSLCYYLNVPKNSGNIVFKSFESMFDMCPLPIPDQYVNTNSYKTVSYTPSAGSLLIFRSNVLHMVEQNLSNENRISISMNFNLIKK